MIGSWDLSQIQIACPSPRLHSRWNRFQHAEKIRERPHIQDARVDRGQPRNTPVRRTCRRRSRSLEIAAESLWVIESSSLERFKPVEWIVALGAL